MKKFFLIMIGLSVGLMADFVRDINTSIVTDTATGLQWQDDATPVTMTWQDAIDYCEALTLGGKSDWRLANVNELGSLVDDVSHNPAISNTFQNTTVSGNYWSSTSSMSYTWYALVVYFYNGSYSLGVKTSNGYVRCVRTKQ